MGERWPCFGPLTPLLRRAAAVAAAAAFASLACGSVLGPVVPGRSQFDELSQRLPQTIAAAGHCLTHWRWHWRCVCLEQGVFVIAVVQRQQLLQLCVVVAVVRVAVVVVVAAVVMLFLVE